MSFEIIFANENFLRSSGMSLWKVYLFIFFYLASNRAHMKYIIPISIFGDTWFLWSWCCTNVHYINLFSCPSSRVVYGCRNTKPIHKPYSHYLFDVYNGHVEFNLWNLYFLPLYPIQDTSMYFCSHCPRGFLIFHTIRENINNSLRLG